MPPRTTKGPLPRGEGARRPPQDRGSTHTIRRHARAQTTPLRGEVQGQLHMEGVGVIRTAGSVWAGAAARHENIPAAEAGTLKTRLLSRRDGVNPLNTVGMRSAGVDDVQPGCPPAIAPRTDRHRSEDGAPRGGATADRRTGPACLKPPALLAGRPVQGPEPEVASAVLGVFLRAIGAALGRALDRASSPLLGPGVPPGQVGGATPSGTSEGTVVPS